MINLTIKKSYRKWKRNWFLSESRPKDWVLPAGRVSWAQELCHIGKEGHPRLEYHAGSALETLRWSLFNMKVKQIKVTDNERSPKQGRGRQVPEESLIERYWSDGSWHACPLLSALSLSSCHLELKKKCTSWFERSKTIEKRTEGVGKEVFHLLQHVCYSLVGSECTLVHLAIGAFRIYRTLYIQGRTFSVMYWFWHGICFEMR